MKRLDRFFWVVVPQRVAWISRLLGVILADGAYLRAWPKIAAVVPLLGLLLGLVAGVAHPGTTYSDSLPLMIGLAVAGALGGGLGWWTLVGFALGDLFSHQRMVYTNPYDPIPIALRSYGSGLFSYLLLAGLVIVVPMAAMAMRREIDRTTRHWFAGGLVGDAIQVLLAAVFAYAWSESAAFLLRPLWTFRSDSPDLTSIQPLQEQARALAMGMAVGVALRLVLTRIAARVSPWVIVMTPPLPRRARIPAWLLILPRALLLTLLLSGLLSDWTEAAIVAGCLALVTAVRVLVVPRLTDLVALVTRVPTVVRLLVVALLGYAAGALAQPLADQGVQSFVPMLIALVPSLLLAAVLFPPRPPSSPLETAPGANA